MIIVNFRLESEQLPGIDFHPSLRSSVVVDVDESERQRVVELVRTYLGYADSNLTVMLAGLSENEREDARRRIFNLDDLVAMLATVGIRAVRPAVVESTVVTP